MFTRVENQIKSVEVSIGMDLSFTPATKDIVDIVVKNQYGRFPISLKRKLYCNTLKVNLISVRQAAESGYGTKFKEELCEV